MADTYRLRLIEALKEVLGGLTDDHQVCLYCEDEEWYQIDDGPHHPECRVGKAETLIKEIEELHRLETL